MTDVRVISRPVRIGVVSRPSPIRVTAGTAQRVRAASPTTVVDVDNPACPIVVRDPETLVIDTGSKQGVPGRPGPPGPAGGTSVEYPIGTTIFGLRAVRADNGLLYHPDLQDVSHAMQTFGIALQSATTGLVLVQLSGQLMEQSWTWSPGAVYCGQDGQLTQVIPPTGWLLSVGRAIGPTTINIDIDTPFVRA